MSNLEDWLTQMQTTSDTTQDVEVSKKENTLSISVELNAMDKRNKSFYDNLSEQHKKEISPYVLMRFMSSAETNSEHHLLAVNDLVNHNFSELNKHKELQWQLLAICGTSKPHRHNWIAPPKKGSKKNLLEETVTTIYPLMKTDDLDLFLKINKKEDLINLFKDNGISDSEIKEIFKENDNKSKI